MSCSVSVFENVSHLQMPSFTEVYLEDVAGGAPRINQHLVKERISLVAVVAAANGSLRRSEEVKVDFRKVR